MIWVLTDNPDGHDCGGIWVDMRQGRDTIILWANKQTRSGQLWFNSLVTRIRSAYSNAVMPTRSARIFSSAAAASASSIFLVLSRDGFRLTTNPTNSVSISSFDRRGVCSSSSGNVLRTTCSTAVSFSSIDALGLSRAILSRRNGSFLSMTSTQNREGRDDRSQNRRDLQECGLTDWIRR